MDFSDKLKTLRLQANMTQEQLAEHLCVSRQAVSNYEQGRSYPSIDALARMCNLFNTSLDELLDTGIKRRYMKLMLIITVALFFSMLACLVSNYVVAGKEGYSELALVFGIAVFIVPFVCLIVYLIFHYKPPKKINGLYGYRTRRSMDSQLAWDYAQAYFSLVYAYIACIFFTLNIVYFVVAMFLSLNAYLICGIVLLCVQMVFLALPIFFTEQKLKLFAKKNRYVQYFN